MITLWSKKRTSFIRVGNKGLIKASLAIINSYYLLEGMKPQFKFKDSSYSAFTEQKTK